MQANLDRILRAATDNGSIPGVVAAAANPDGQIYAGAAGKRALPDGAPMTTDSVFWIASMTKAITSTAAMQLVEQGRLELDRPIGELLPELAAPQVLEGFDDSGEARLRPARRAITLRHLLTHTAGFGYDIWSADLLRYREAKGIPPVISCRNLALSLPLKFDPGERWDYGINIDWVGKAVEAVSGQTLDAYLRQHVLDPLGMRDTVFRLRPDMRGRLAGMHGRQPDGRLEPMDFELPQEPEFHMGGGGLYGTAADYIRFTRMFLNDGSLDGARVLAPATVRLMAENHIGEIDVCLLETAIAPFSNDAEFFPGMRKKWGLGFMINTEAAPGGGRTAGSLAWAGLGNTYFWIDPASGVSGVVLAQLVPFADPAVLDLFAAFETAVYAETSPGR